MLVKCPIRINQYLHGSHSHGTDNFQEFIEFFIWALPQSEDILLCLCALMESLSNFYPSTLPYKQEICGIMVHHSHSFHSVRQLCNSSLAQPMVVWPCWNYTNNLDPTPKLHPPAPTLCLCVFKLAYVLVLSHDKLTNHLPMKGKINLHVVFFHELLITSTTH